MQATTITPEIALVTAIRGVCKAGVTFQTTMYPANMAKTKIPNLKIKISSVKYPIQKVTINPIRNMTKYPPRP